MPIDDELRKAVHEAIIKHGQPLSLEKQLLAMLDDLSARGASEEGQMLGINLLVQAVVPPPGSLADQL